jgi:hypothetical protein
MRFPVQRFPLRLAAVWLVIVAACSSFLHDLSCLADATCDVSKPADTPGSCPLTQLPSGAHGGECLDNGTCTDPGDACIDNNCITCGQPGHVCCDQKNAKGCTASTCVTGVDDFPTCHNDCGYSTGPCCTGQSDPCPTSGYCDNSSATCKPDSTEPTGGGSYFVWFLTSGKCAVEPYYFTATSDANANAQATAHLAQINAAQPEDGPFTVAALNVQPAMYPRCGYPPASLNSVDAVIIYAFSALDLTSCEQQLSGGSLAGWSWTTQTNGNCIAP